MNHKSNVGIIGENLACGYLVEKEYRILKRNYREKWGEIDIIAKSKDNTLVFFEVKTLYNIGPTSNQLEPEDHLTTAKLKKLRRTCEVFCNKNPEIVDERKGWQIDLLAVVIKNQTLNEGDVNVLTKKRENFIIRHYEKL